MQLQQIIEEHWYRRANFRLSLLLWPLAVVFSIISRLRRLAYRKGWLPSYQLSVPVVVVGNISVGGVGKTPLCKFLASELNAKGYQVGIILRGYKGSYKLPRLVNATDKSALVGDEALIYAQAGIKVAIGRNRVAAGQLLLQKHPELQLVIADDGLQHYRLKRDFEICVVDGTRLFGNGKILPLGPLRESVERLKSVDAIVVNGKLGLNKNLFSPKRGRLWTLFCGAKHRKPNNTLPPIYQQDLVFKQFYNPKRQQVATVEELNQLNCQPLAAIGNPERFFNYLRELGLDFGQGQAFPDHYHYLATDIDSNCAIITTEKDYTKLAHFDCANIWVTQVEAQLNDNRLLDDLIKLIN